VTSPDGGGGLLVWVVCHLGKATGGLVIRKTGAKVHVVGATRNGLLERRREARGKYVMVPGVRSYLWLILGTVEERTDL
jgi:hypothetical protein